MAKVLDCGRRVSEFEFNLRYYVHFQTINLGEKFEPYYPPPAMG